MSLLEDFAKRCVLMEKTRTPDGAGGSITAWTEGMEFENFSAMDNSLEARIAEKQGVTSVYSGLVKKSLEIEFGDYYKDLDTGFTYRVTSNPDEKQAPKGSSFELKYFTAERKALPK